MRGAGFFRFCYDDDRRPLEEEPSLLAMRGTPLQLSGIGPRRGGAFSET